MLDGLSQVSNTDIEIEYKASGPEDDQNFIKELHSSSNQNKLLQPIMSHKDYPAEPPEDLIGD